MSVYLFVCVPACLSVCLPFCLFVFLIRSLLFSFVSEAYRSDEHAGSVCRDGCWDSCCIPDADCRDLMETKSSTEVYQEKSKVRDKKNFLLEYYLINSYF